MRNDMAAIAIKFTTNEMANNPPQSRMGIFGHDAIHQSSFIVTKKIISGEIDPRVKVNVKSTSIGKLWEMLARHPLTDQRDKDFIMEQEKMFRKTLLAEIVEVESGEVAGVAQITDTDRLQFIPTILASYMKSQNVKDWEALNYANSDKRGLDWKELIVEMFNDEEHDVQTHIQH